MNDVTSAGVFDLLPPNLRSDPSIAAAARAIDEKLRGATDEILKLCYYVRLDELTPEETDELAWQWHVDFYDPSLPVEKRRELVKRSLGWHKRKGTPSAVEEIVSAAFDSATVFEWFEYAGEPFHFKVQTRDIITEEKYNQVVRAINSVKRASAVLDDIEVIRDYKQTIEVSSAFNRYLYGIPFAGTFLCGTWPGQATIGKLYQSTEELSRSDYQGNQWAYRVAAKMVAGTEEVPEALNINAEAIVTTTMEINKKRREYAFCGITICGSGATT